MYISIMAREKAPYIFIEGQSSDSTPGNGLPLRQPAIVWLTDKEAGTIGEKYNPHSTVRGRIAFAIAVGRASCGGRGR